MIFIKHNNIWLHDSCCGISEHYYSNFCKGRMCQNCIHEKFNLGFNYLRMYSLKDERKDIISGSFVLLMEEENEK